MGMQAERETRVDHWTDMGSGSQGRLGPWVASRGSFTGLQNQASLIGYSEPLFRTLFVKRNETIPCVSNGPPQQPLTLSPACGLGVSWGW